MDTDKNLAKPDTNKKSRFPGGRFGLSVVGFAAVNAAIIAAVTSSHWAFPGGSIEQDVLSHNLKQSPSYGTWTWWAARGYFQEAKAPDIAMMGSSLVNSACWAADAVSTKNDVDCAVHHRVFTLEQLIKDRLGGKAPTVVNVSVQGAGACDFYMMTRGLMEGKRKPKLLIVGIAPRDFVDNKMHNLGDTEPFMFYQRYVNFDPEVSRAYSNSYNRAMGQLEWGLGRLPLRRFHSAVASHLTDDSTVDKTRKEAGDQLRSALSTRSLKVYPGDIVVSHEMAEGCFDNSAEYVKRFQNPHPKQFKTQLFFFEEMLRRMKDQNVKVLVVDMPTLEKHRAMLPPTFWAEYKQKIDDICKRQTATHFYLADSPEFSTDDFVDLVHVNWRGGGKLLAKIADEIADVPQLSSLLNAGGKPGDGHQMLSSKKSTVAN
ncbi:MAG: hypothetical protein C0507_09050 [Cyanobacteria bacterium PR.3.49]|nr:hypothetical protein [Cyanobacteria bacterium PR.3.49]